MTYVLDTNIILFSILNPTFVINGTLITADKDFNHLADVYFPIHLVDINDFR